MKFSLSAKSARSYFLINIPLIVLGYLLHLGLFYSIIDLSLRLPVTHWIPRKFLQIVLLFVKNWVLLLLLDHFTRSRADIVKRTESETISYKDVHGYIFKFAVMESLTYDCGIYFNLLNSSRSTAALSPVSATWYLYFIATSFIYEIIFDFFHYWAHRIVHDVPSWYKVVHKLHHKCINPSVYYTFDDTILGILLSNCIPQLLTMAIYSHAFGPLSILDFATISIYKTFVEISGHSGKRVGSAGSFPQFKWLPRMLGIDLYTEDHHLHHRNCQFNFSKRFVLWDKVFNTYKESELSGGKE